MSVHWNTVSLVLRDRTVTSGVSDPAQRRAASGGIPAKGARFRVRRPATSGLEVLHGGA